MELELVVCVQYRKIIHNQPWTTIVHRISSPLSTLIVVVILGLSIQCIHSRQHTANSKLFECSNSWHWLQKNTKWLKFRQFDNHH